VRLGRHIITIGITTEQASAAPLQLQALLSHWETLTAVITDAATSSMG
jgi:hypothetical protein